jgi:hypothetical protein
MKAGKELDAKIALLVEGPWDEKRCRICGWPLYERVDQGCVSENCSLRPGPERRADEPAPYSTDLECAFRVVAFILAQKPNARMEILSPRGTIDGVWAVGFVPLQYAHEDTLPLAICRAALYSFETVKI